jgi:hypothetical protein
LSETAKALADPSAEMTTPSMGVPASSWTWPTIWPVVMAASSVMRSA